MFSTRDMVARKLMAVAPRFLPFAEFATDDLPLRRLLRLSLFQVTVGMALVLLVGAGVHPVQTVGLALATDLVRNEDQPNVVGLMYVMLLLGMIVAAFVYGRLLEPYTPARLIGVIQGTAVVTILLNGIAMWKQEPRDRERARAGRPKPTFGGAWAQFMSGANATRLLVVIGLGTFGFGMADVLLEPYGGQVLGMSVAATTKLTAVLAGGSLAGFWLASRTLARGASPTRMAWAGALVGVPAFGAIIAAAQGGGVGLFTFAVLAAVLFGHGTLTATMRNAPREQVGLALGAWGAVQATCAGIAIAIGGIIRDMVLAAPGADARGAEAACIPVFALEMAFLILAVIAVWHPQEPAGPENRWNRPTGGTCLLTDCRAGIWP